jgi:hypothetical protein
MATLEQFLQWSKSLHRSIIPGIRRFFTRTIESILTGGRKGKMETLADWCMLEPITDRELRPSKEF